MRTLSTNVGKIVRIRREGSALIGKKVRVVIGSPCHPKVQINGLNQPLKFRV